MEVIKGNKPLQQKGSTVERNELIRLAKAKQEAEKACHDAWYKVENKAPMMESEQFWPLLDHVAYEIKVFRFGYGRSNGVKQGANEVGRQICTGQLPKELSHVTIDDFVSFAKTYNALDGRLSNALWSVVEGYSDDSYGDLIDTVPLLGRDFCKRALDGEWQEGDHNEFIQAIKDEVMDKWADDSKRIGQSKARVVDFFVHGEEYVEMAISEAAEKWLFYILADQEEEEPQEHSFV
jgi:hypothetical protein